MSPNPYLLAATILVAVGFAIWLAVEPRIIARHNAKAADDFERIGRTDKLNPTPDDDAGTVTLRVLGIVALIALTILATVVTT